jgi:2-oxoglutarate dehydrogenase E2 component (dihydrolipoamide succinyltransferase)
MAIVEVKVPQLSESVAEGTLLQWKKKPGEAVAIDEILIEIETDKVVLEVPAPSAGVLAEIWSSDGGTVTADQVIARIDTEGKAAAAPAAPARCEAAIGAGTCSAVAPRRAPAAPSPTWPCRRRQADGRQQPGAGSVPAPAGRPRDQGRRAGRRGRRRRQARRRRPSAAAPAAAGAACRWPRRPAPDLGDRPEQRVPMSRLRARIAERLLQSQSTNAILTTFNEVNMAPVMEMRKRFQEKFEKEHGVKIGFMSFFVKAAVHALKKYPVLNASVDGNDIVYHGYFDIGIAVGSPRGLVVPILRNADQMSFADIEKKIAEYGAKARDGKLGIEEMTGGTFSISNGGVFGSMLSTPIINPPQSAILGVHATKDRAVVENGQIVVRPMNYLAMSYDHRIIDGREAVLGLVAMKEALEDPARLLFDI